MNKSRMTFLILLLPILFTFACGKNNLHSFSTETFSDTEQLVSKQEDTQDNQETQRQFPEEEILQPLSLNDVNHYLITPETPIQEMIYNYLTLESIDEVKNLAAELSSFLLDPVEAKVYRLESKAYVAKLLKAKVLQDYHKERLALLDEVRLQLMQEWEREDEDLNFVKNMGDYAIGGMAIGTGGTLLGSSFNAIKEKVRNNPFIQRWTERVLNAELKHFNFYRMQRMGERESLLTSITKTARYLATHRKIQRAALRATPSMRDSVIHTYALANTQEALQIMYATSIMVAKNTRVFSQFSSKPIFEKSINKDLLAEANQRAWLTNAPRGIEYYVKDNGQEALVKVSISGETKIFQLNATHPEAGEINSQMIRGLKVLKMRPNYDFVHIVENESLVATALSSQSLELAAKEIRPFIPSHPTKIQIFKGNQVGLWAGIVLGYNYTQLFNNERSFVFEQIYEDPDIDGKTLSQIIKHEK